MLIAHTRIHTYIQNGSWHFGKPFPSVCPVWLRKTGKPGSSRSPLLYNSICSPCARFMKPNRQVRGNQGHPGVPFYTIQCALRCLFSWEFQLIDRYAWREGNGCLALCACIYMYVCVYVCMCVCVCMYVFWLIDRYAWQEGNGCLALCVCTYVCMYVCMYVCIPTNWPLRMTRR
jgi:hypothetical protein